MSSKPKNPAQEIPYIDKVVQIMSKGESATFVYFRNMTDENKKRFADAVVEYGYVIGDGNRRGGYMIYKKTR